MPAIILSPAELRWAEWAIEPMRAHWCTQAGAEERDGEILSESVLPLLVGSVLGWNMMPEEVLEDLLYRLEEQAPDVAQTDADSPRHAASRAAAALRLARKIKEIV